MPEALASRTKGYAWTTVTDMTEDKLARLLCSAVQDAVDQYGLLHSRPNQALLLARWMNEPRKADGTSLFEVSFVERVVYALLERAPEEEIVGWEAPYPSNSDWKGAWLDFGIGLIPDSTVRLFRIAVEAKWWHSAFARWPAPIIKDALKLLHYRCPDAANDIQRFLLLVSQDHANYDEDVENILVEMNPFKEEATKASRSLSEYLAGPFVVGWSDTSRQQVARSLDDRVDEAGLFEGPPLFFRSGTSEGGSPGGVVATLLRVRPPAP